MPDEPGANGPGKRQGGPVAASLFLAALMTAACGCGTMPNSRGWGQDATLSPGWGRIGQAAKAAATAPETWVPAAGALAFRTGQADRHLEEWAVRNTPLFGSPERADKKSYELRDAAAAAWVASAVAAPGGDTLSEWAVNKAGGLGIQAGAGAIMRGTVGVLKDATDRARPNGVDRESFPSAHATASSFYATLASRNIETMSWPSPATTLSQIGLGAVTAATAWARVEAGQHFPSDVLGGIALGHFLGIFFTDAFLGLDNPQHALVLVEPGREGTVLLVRFNY